MSDLMFKGVRVERIYEKIVTQIRNLIQEGQLHPGDRLPSERDLSETLGCSRASLREAFRVLESEGLIITKHGDGRYIQTINQNVALEYRFSTVDMIEKSATLYFLEAREALEPKIAAMAAERATAEQLDKMQRVITKMSEKLRNPSAKVEGDSAFHLAMAEATQNFVFVSMMEANLSMIRQIRRQTLVSQERYIASLAEHQAILDAIKDKNTAAAVDATILHLKNLSANILQHESADSKEAKE